LVRVFVFFFQAEDGIRGFHVTGVQTCALPIYRGGVAMVGEAGRELVRLPKGSRIFSNYQTEQMLMGVMRAPTLVTPSVQFGDIYIKDSLDVEQFKSIVTQTVRGMLK